MTPASMPPVCILDQKFLLIPLSLPSIHIFPFLIDKNSSLPPLSHWSTFLCPISHWPTFLSAPALSLVNVPLHRRSHWSTFICPSFSLANIPLCPLLLINVAPSVPDLDPNPDPDPPDPHVFWPPGSGSTSQRYGSGSGSGSRSFYHHAKIIRKILNPTILWLFLTFYLWKIM